MRPGANVSVAKSAIVHQPKEGGFLKPPSCLSSSEQVLSVLEQPVRESAGPANVELGVVESGPVEVVDPSGAFREHAKPRSRNLVADAETEAGPTDPAVALGRIKLAALEFLW